jgi:hypothetical protein
MDTFQLFILFVSLTITFPTTYGAKHKHPVKNGFRFSTEEPVSQVYKFIVHLLKTEYKGCDVNLLLDSEWLAGEILLDPRNEFITDLMKNGHWAREIPIELGKERNDLDSKYSHHNSSSNQRKISMTGRYKNHACNIFILEIWNDVFLSNYLYAIKKELHPTPLRKAKCILINWKSFRSSFKTSKTFQPSLLNEPILKKRLINKVELTMSYKYHSDNDLHCHVLLYTSNMDCKENGSGFRGDAKLIGAFSLAHGFRNYTNSGIFPLKIKNFCKTKLYVAVPNLSGTGPAKVSEKRQDLGIAKKIFTELKFHVDNTSYVGMGGPSIGKEYDEELNRFFRKYEMSVGITYFQGRNTWKLQRSRHYGMETLIMVYRRKVYSKHAMENTYRTADILGRVSFLLLMGAATFLLLSRRWDLLSQARYPKPKRNRESWKFHNRRITM